MLPRPSRFFWGYQGGGAHSHWGATHSTVRGVRLPRAKPHQRDAPNTPIPGGAQCPDQKMGLEPQTFLVCYSDCISLLPTSPWHSLVTQLVMLVLR